MLSAVTNVHRPRALTLYEPLDGRKIAPESTVAFSMIHRGRSIS